MSCDAETIHVLSDEQAVVCSICGSRLVTFNEESGSKQACIDNRRIDFDE